MLSKNLFFILSTRGRLETSNLHLKMWKAILLTVYRMLDGKTYMTLALFPNRPHLCRTFVVSWSPFIAQGCVVKLNVGHLYCSSPGIQIYVMILCALGLYPSTRRTLNKLAVSKLKWTYILRNPIQNAVCYEQNIRFLCKGINVSWDCKMSLMNVFLIQL